MSKGIAALAYLPKTSITISSGALDGSVEAYKAVVKKLAQAQSDGKEIVAKDIACHGTDPYMEHVFTTSAFKASTGVVTVAAPTAGDTIAVNGLVYTAVAGVKANNTQFSTTGSDTVKAGDLVASVNADQRKGTKGSIKASNVAGVVTFTQVGLVGIAGNGTTLVSSNATRLAVTASPFTTGTGISATFKEESNVTVTDAKGRSALSTRRKVQINITATANQANLRSINAVINFVEKMEDLVASTGVSASGDKTYTNIVLKGHTPWESFTWTVVKLGKVYTATATANS